MVIMASIADAMTTASLASLSPRACIVRRSQIPRLAEVKIYHESIAVSETPTIKIPPMDRKNYGAHEAKAGRNANSSRR
jgi:hypothetical protein